MPILRSLLLGRPHAYYLNGTCALGRPLLAEMGACDDFLELLDLLRRVFDLHLFAWAVETDGYHLILRHAENGLIADDHVLERWRLLGGRTLPTAAQIRCRLTTLSGLMQTLAQRYSRMYHRRFGGRGSIWAGRYRACLLADDAAISLAVTVLESERLCHGRALRTSRDGRSPDAPRLTPLPLKSLPDGGVVFADEAPLHLPPAVSEDERSFYAAFRCGIDPDLPLYADILTRAWAVGRPESLTEALSRLGRPSGRGRRRQLRELDDSLGVCAVWG